MDPITIMMIAGTAMQFLGGQQQEEAKKKAGAANAKYLRESAAVTRNLAKEDERRFRVESRKHIGGMQAAQGASGVQNTGSALEVLMESAATAEMDALTVKYQGEYKSWQLEREASIAEMDGGSGMGGVGSLFSGAAQILSRK